REVRAQHGWLGGSEGLHRGRHITVAAPPTCAVVPSRRTVTASTTPPAAPPATRRRAVGETAAAAAVGGILAAGEPTGLRLADALWRGALAAGVTLAAPRSRRWPLFVLTGCAAALSTGFAQVLGIVSLALAFVTLRRRRADRVLDAAIG